METIKRTFLLYVQCKERVQTKYQQLECVIESVLTRCKREIRTGCVVTKIKQCLQRITIENKRNGGIECYLIQRGENI